MSSIYTILHLDDSKDFLDLFRKNCAEHNSLFYVISSISPQKALYLMDQIDFDVVISDFDLPEMNGIEFLKTVRAAGYGGAFIFLTGRSDEEVAAQALHLGADDFYQKDTIMESFDNLLKGIESAVKNRHFDKEKIRSREKLFQVFNKVSLVVYELDRNGVLINVNKAFENFLGYRCEDIIGQPLIKFIDPSSRKSAENLIMGEWDPQTYEILSSNPSAEIEFISKNGEKKNGLIQSVFIFPEGCRNTKRHLAGNIGIIKDINQIKAVLQESNYRILFENTITAMLLISDSFTVLECNEKTCKLFGYDKKEIIGRSFDKLLSPGQDGKKTTADILNKYLKAAQLETPQSFVWKQNGKDGKRVDFEITLSKVVFDQRILIQAGIRDVTERNLVMRDIESSEQRYRQFADNLNIAAAFIKSGRIIFSNRKLTQILGYKSGGELTGARLSSVIHPSDRRTVLELATEYERQKKKAAEKDIRVICKNGTSIHMRLMMDSSTFLNSSICAITFIPAHTESKESKTKITAKSRLTPYLDSIAAPLIQLDLNGKITSFNGLAEDLLKFNITSFMGKSIFSIISPGCIKTVKKAFDLAKNGDISSSPLLFKPYPQEISIRFTPLIDNLKKTDTILAELISGPEQTGRIQSLISAGSSYYDLIEAAHEGIAMTDEYENLIYSNPAFAEMLHYSFDELSGKPLKKILPPGQWDKVLKETSKRKKGKSNRYLLTMLNKEGKERKVQLSVSPVKDMMGLYKGGVAVISDITEREKIASDLMLANKRLSVLIEVINATHSKLPLKRMAAEALSSAVKFTGRNSGVIYLFDDRRKIYFFISKGIDDERASALKTIDFTKEPFSKIITGKMITDAKPFPLCIFIPMILENETIGCLGLFRKNTDALTAEDEDALKYLSGEIADGIRQNKYEEQLKEAAKKYERLFDQTSVGVILFDTDFRIIQANSAASRLTGYSKNELTRITLEHISPYKIKEMRRKIEQMYGNPYICQHSLNRKNGESLEVLNSSILLKDKDGKTAGFQTVLQDVTTEVKNREKLNHLSSLRNSLNVISEELLILKPIREKLDYLTRESVKRLDVSLMMIWLFDDSYCSSFPAEYPKFSVKYPDGSKKSAGILKLASCYPKSAVSTIKITSGRGEIPFTILLTEQSKTYPLDRVIKNVTINPFDVKKLRKMEIRSIELYPLKGLNGERIGVACLLHKKHTDADVRELYKTVAELTGRIVVECSTNEALKESLFNYRYLYESALSGIYRTSIYDGTFLSANQATAEILGFRNVTSLLETCKFSDIYPQEERTRFLKILQKEGMIEDFEIHATLPNGKQVDLLINARLFEKLGYIEGSIANVTKLKILEEELRKKNAEMENFIYSVSHDLKSPLFSISGYMEMLNDPKIQEKQKTKVTGSIQRNINEMSSFISGLLDLSRAGKVIGDYDEIPLNSIIHSIFEEMRIRSEGIIFTAENIPQKINAASRIKEAFLNLISNAVHAKKKDMTLHLKVSCRPIGDQWEFSITDNGKGIAKGNLEKIFLPGFTTSAGKTKGSGFGLPIAKRIIEAHNGAIRAVSEEGKETSFIFTIPMNPIRKE